MGKIALKYSGDRGFTLVEMLAVMGIMLTMMSMLLPALNDVLNSKGRKAAVNMLLNSFEQARVAALEQSTNVYVGFADKNITGSVAAGSSLVPYTHFIIFRDKIGDVDAASSPAYIPLTKWLPLPKGISFKSGTATVADGSTGETITLAANTFPSITQNYSIPVVKFNSTGTIASQQGVANLWLFIYEGFYSVGTGDVHVRLGTDDPTKRLFERISFARYTGRAQLDITTLSGA